MRFGIRAHDFGRLPVEALAQRISEKGYNSVQLSLRAAVEGMENIDGKINSGMAYYVEDTFRKNNLQIAVMSCYINPVDPDEKELRRQINNFKEMIRYARDFGCGIVATETGSLNRDFSYNAKNHEEEAFQTLIKSVSEMVKEAEKFGVTVCIEGVTSYVIHDPKSIKRMLDTINSSNLQILFDPVNLLSIDTYKNQDSIIEEAFQLFGDRISIVHIKDFIIEDGKMKSVPIGEGLLNYQLLLKYFKANKPYINFVMEEVDITKINSSMEYLNNIYNQIF